jgi:hypothetical protein
MDMVEIPLVESRSWNMHGYFLTLTTKEEARQGEAAVANDRGSKQLRGIKRKPYISNFPNFTFSQSSALLLTNSLKTVGMRQCHLPMVVKKVLEQPAAVWCHMNLRF